MKRVVSFLLFLALIPSLSAVWEKFQADNFNTGKADGAGNFGSTAIVNITISEGMNFQPLVSDVNNDGQNEIVIFSGNYLKIYDGNLNLIDENFVGILQGQPAIFNIDNDDFREIIFISNISDVDYFSAYEYSNNFNQEFNFTVANGGVGSGIKCAELEGTKACIFMDNAQYVHIVDTVSKVDESFNTSAYTDTLEKIPAIGDLHNDNGLEAVFWFDENNDNRYGLLVFDLVNKQFDIDFNGNGIRDDIMVPFGVNSNLFVLKGHPVLADLNKDSKLEIAASIFYDDQIPLFDARDWFTELFVFEHNGTKLYRKCEERTNSMDGNCNDGSDDTSKWEGTNPFVLDANNDDIDDICFIKDKKKTIGAIGFKNMTINCYDYSGSKILDSEIPGDTVKTATVADMNNDNVPEIITENYIYALNGSPVFLHNFGYNYAIPADVDNDNELDLLLSKNGQTILFKKNVTIEEESLLEKYAPVLYFHPDELFFPTTIDAMLNESDLKRRILFGNDTIEDQLPISLDNLDNATDDFYMDMVDATAGLFPDVPDAARFDNYPDNVYGRDYEVNEDYRVLQYWFFYDYNNFRGGHEGDWEMIQIILNNTNEEPLSSTYSYHYDAITYNWTEIMKIDETHPKVFVARGGHASYKDNESIWVYSNVSGEEVGTSNYTLFHHKKTSVSNVSEMVVVIDKYSIVQVADSTDWIHFPGRWGEINVLLSWHIGPNSPANNQFGGINKWNSPIEFAENSRPDQTTAITGSPVNLHAYDKEGRHVGLNEFGEIEAEIPNTYLYVPSDNGKEVIVILSNEEINFVIEATDNGAFNLSINTYNRDSESEINLEYKDIKITNQTIAMLNFTETNPNFIIQIDEDGDGTVDKTATPYNATIQGNLTNNETDSDNDSYSDSIDNCPNLYNPDQITDFDVDGFDNLLCGGLDCDDSNAYIHPIAEETCNIIDDNCNGQIDELDMDSDGYNDCGEDSCLNTIHDNFVKLNKNHFAGNLNGCSCTDILQCKPGNNEGELKHGCTKGTIDNWLNKRGWAQNCNK